MYVLGLRFEEQGKLDEAEHWLRGAADAGHAEAATHLSALQQEHRSGGLS
jgi:hypothetical protein